MHMNAANSKSSIQMLYNSDAIHRLENDILEDIKHARDTVILLLPKVSMALTILVVTTAANSQDGLTQDVPPMCIGSTTCSAVRILRE